MTAGIKLGTSEAGDQWHLHCATAADGQGPCHRTREFFEHYGSMKLHVIQGNNVCMRFSLMM